MICKDCGHPDTSHNDAGCFHDDGGPPCFCRTSGEQIRLPEQWEPKSESENELFVDGGVVGTNPSLFGGTYAWRQVVNGVAALEGAHFITPADARVPAVTNNLTEMLAMIKGMESLPHDWNGTVLSDSQITLGRVFLGWKWNNVPAWVHRRFQSVRARLANYEAFEHVLLAGHPTRKQLEAGVGRHGYRVSIHNVWCDEACKDAGLEALQQMQFKFQPTVEQSYATN